MGGLTITREDLDKPLTEAYGLPVLLNLVQLDLAKQQCVRAGITIAPAQIAAERQTTFEKLFSDAKPEDYPGLFDQLLRQKHLSRTEFDQVIETTAYLRAYAKPQLPGKITDEQVHEAYGQLYGENRRIRDIQLANFLQTSVAQRKLAAGEPFEQVAAEMSTDRRTAAVGGEIAAFAALSPNIPKAIRDVTFTLKVGQVSDPITAGDNYHLIKLDQIIPPKIVKYGRRQSRPCGSGWKTSGRSFPSTRSAAKSGRSR